MKKILATLLVLGIILFIFTGCSNNLSPIMENTTSTPTSPSTSPIESTVYIDWQNLSIEELQQIYWNSDIITDDTDIYSFSSYDETICWLEDDDYHRFYNPRHAEDGSLIYINEYGYIDSKDINIPYGVIANTCPDENSTVILSSPEVTVFWNESLGKIVEKVNNNVTRSELLPINSRYVGYSFWAGFIFQAEDRVFSVFAYNEEEPVVLISENVDVVIATDIKLTSDAWSNPLFLMKDGSLKGYITWEDELVDYSGCTADSYYPYL